MSKKKNNKFSVGLPSQLFSSPKKLFLSTLCLAGFFLTVYLFFFHLGRTPLENWDEAFYGQATKEMLLTRDPVVLHWDYAVWFDKPPMYIWVTSFFSLIFGLSEFAIRLPSAISAVIILLLATLYVYRRYSLLPAVFTFLTLLTNNLFVWRGRSGNIDLLVSLEIFLTFLLVQWKHPKRYLFLGLLFACIYLTKASLVIFPFSIFIGHEVFFQRKQIRTNVKWYLLLLLLFFGISGTWIFLGYFEAGKSFVHYYLFQSDQGVSVLTNFNKNYLLHTYYALQRRFFWLFLFGSVIALWKSRRAEYALLIMFSWFLLLQLSFTARDNNWYLLPSMPFWSITIGFGVYMLLRILRKNRLLYFGGTGVFLLASGYIFVKTFTVNILPILNSSTVIEQAESAKRVSMLSKKGDVVVRLDPLIATTLYYTDRKTYAFARDTGEHEYWVGQVGIKNGIRDKHIQWLVGMIGDIRFIEDTFGGSRFERIPVNNVEAILRVK